MRKAVVAQSVVAAIVLLVLSSATAAEAHTEAQGGIIRSVPPEVLAALKRGDNKDAAEHFMKLHEIMRDGVGVPKNNAEYVVGPWLTFDPKTERHTGDHAEAANALLKDPNNKGSKCRRSRTCSDRLANSTRRGFDVGLFLR